MRRLTTLLVTAPLLLVLVVFAVENRQDVVLNLWPFGSVATELFVLALGLLALGLLIGGLMIWVQLVRWRVRARSLERRAVELEAALAENRAIVAHLREPAPSGPALAPPAG
jgi:uncharacterized integral membrane protein